MEELLLAAAASFPASAVIASAAEAAVLSFGTAPGCAFDPDPDPEPVFEPALEV